MEDKVTGALIGAINEIVGMPVVKRALEVLLPTSVRTKVHHAFWWHKWDRTPGKSRCDFEAVFCQEKGLQRIVLTLTVTTDESRECSPAQEISARFIPWREIAELIEAYPVTHTPGAGSVISATVGTLVLKSGEKLSIIPPPGAEAAAGVQIHGGEPNVIYRDIGLFLADIAGRIG